MNSLGERIQILRKESFGMNQSAFAQVLGVSQGALSEMERNRRGIPSEALISLIKYSKENILFSCEWLLTGEGEMYIEPRRSVRQLTPTQKTIAAEQFEMLTEDQVALINSYEKLGRNDKEEIWALIQIKVSRTPGLSSNSQTSKNEAG